MGLEPTTFGTTIRRSNQLSYIHRFATAKVVPFAKSAISTPNFSPIDYTNALINRDKNFSSKRAELLVAPIFPLYSPRVLILLNGDSSRPFAPPWASH